MIGGPIRHPLAAALAIPTLRTTLFSRWLPAVAVLSLGGAAIAGAADGFNLGEFDQEGLTFGATIAAWTRPAYPAELVARQSEGEVKVRMWVDREGRVGKGWVVETFDPLASVAALQAIQAWHFRPALFDGRPVACCMEAPVLFRLKNLAKKKKAHRPVPSLAELPHGVRTEDPVAVDRGDPPFAPDLLARFSGEHIDVEVEVDDQGAVVAGQVLQAPDPAFIGPTLAAMKRWKFEPARQDGLPVPCFHLSTIVLESASSTTIAAPSLTGQGLLSPRP